jgi:hypothetical protein
LNRTFTTPTNAKKFTISAWVKITSPSGSLLDFSLLSGANSSEIIGVSGVGAFGASVNNRLIVRFGDSNLVYYPQLFRDVSAWAHIVVAIDTDQATQSDRAKFYYNGVLQTATSSTITSGYSPALNTAATRYIGGLSTNAGYYANGYLAEYNFIDGLTPNTTTRTVNGVTETILTELGQFNANTGVWEPAAWTRAFGTNGFFLKFADNSGTTSTTLGKDSSGNGNNWTPNLFSVTAGAGNDSLVDSPTNYGTDTGAGGEVRGNYATLNPIVPPSARTTLSNGNLQVVGSSSVESGCDYGTVGVSSGKWYWENTVTAISSASSYPNLGSVRTLHPNSNAKFIGDNLSQGFSIFTNGNVYRENSLVTTTTSYTTNDVIGIGLDLDNLEAKFYKNGSLIYTLTGLTAGTYWIGIASYYNSNTALNAGQRPFQKWNGSAYVANTAPSGFKALCTTNLPTPTIGATSTTQANDYFNTVLYTGNGSTQSITGVGFQPDWVWAKSRSNAANHRLFDAVRGASKILYSSLTNEEATDASGLTSFDTNGFSIGSTQVNDSGQTYVAWNWKANGAGSANSNGTAKSSSVTVNSATDTVTWNSHGMSDGQKIGFFAATMPGGLSAGTLYYVRDAATNTFKVAASSGGAAIDITSNGTTVTAHTTLTSTVSANTTAGFSIVKHINSGAPATIEHGLGVAPKFIINKVYDRTENWRVYYGTSNKLLILNSTNAGATDTNIWNNTNPTSNVFSIGTYWSSGDDVISYCFADVEGYSKAFSYASNNTSDNAFVYLGFRPRWIMIKSESAGGTNLDWVIYDTARMTYNYIANTELRANLTTTEGGLARNPAIDILSNGFKVRGSGGEIGSSTLYVGIAFAETPFKYSLAR